MRNTNVNALIAPRSYADLTPHTLVHLIALFTDHIKSRIYFWTRYIHIETTIYFYFELIHIGRVAMHRLHFKVPKTNIADFISYSTVLLKYWIILCVLSVYMVALLYFYFEQVRHVELAITQLHFEVTKISFFVILQMHTTIHYKNSISRSVNSCPTVSTHHLWRNMKWLDAVQKRRFPNKLGTRNTLLIRSCAEGAQC